MFDLGLSEEQEMIRDMAADFGAKRLREACRASERAGRVSDDLVTAFAELDLLGLEVSEELGGSGQGSLEKALVLEGLAAGDAAAALALDGLGPALYPLIEMGRGEADDLIRRALERPRARGWVVVDTEEERFAVDGERIRGSWPWVPASELDLLVVIKGHAAYVVTEGFDVSGVKPCALHAAGSSELQVDGPCDRRLEAGEAGVGRTLARLRVYASALLVGVAQASFEHARAYALERTAFGRPIAHYQSMAFLLADLAIGIDAARLATWRAAWALGQEGDPSEAAAHAFGQAAEAALHMGEQGVQILGAHGYVDDHPVEKWMREARTLSQLWGGRYGAVEAATAAVLETPNRPGFRLPAWKA